MRGLDSGPSRWQRVAGSWVTPADLAGPVRVGRSRGPAENMLLLGGADPGEGFEATIRVLEPSGEAAGGAIVFVDFRNRGDYLAFHFCPGKQLVECFARVGARWRRMGLPVYYPIEVGKSHRIEVKLDGAIRRLRLDGRDLMALKGKAEPGRFGLGSKICPGEFSAIKLLRAGEPARARSVAGR
jgi:hypothetical protein